jgi:hypothetical protein
MTHPLIIRPEAEEDVAEGRDWYDGQRQGQGKLGVTSFSLKNDVTPSFPMLPFRIAAKQLML